MSARESRSVRHLSLSLCASLLSGCLVWSTVAVAQAEIGYLDIIKKLPVPKVHLTFGMRLTERGFDEDNFIDLRAEIDRLEQQLPGKVRAERAWLLGRLATLMQKAGEPDVDVQKRRAAALTIYRGLANTAGLPPQARLQHGHLEAAEGNEPRAILVFVALANDHPRYWPVYGRIVWLQLKSGATDDVTRWVRRGDEELERRLAEGDPDRAAEAYQIFQRVFSRNIAVLKHKQLSPYQVNPVNELGYGMIRRAVDLDPDNATYRGALGSAQLWRLSFALLRNVDSNASELWQALLQAAEAVRQKMPDLVSSAKHNLELVARKHPGRIPLLHVNLAWLALFDGDLPRVENSLLHAIKIAPQNEDSHFALTCFYGAFYMKAGKMRPDKLDHLLSVLRPHRALKRTPKWRCMLAKAEMMQGSYENAREQFAAAFKEQPAYYPTAAGYFQTRLLTAPLQAGDICDEIDEHLARQTDHRGKAELLFTKAMALVFAGHDDAATKLLTELCRDDDASKLPGVKEALSSLTTSR